jgi:hypothetical protein
MVLSSIGEILNPFEQDCRSRTSGEVLLKHGYNRCKTWTLYFDYDGSFLTSTRSKSNLQSMVKGSFFAIILNVFSRGIEGFKTVVCVPVRYSARKGR